MHLKEIKKDVTHKRINHKRINHKMWHCRLGQMTKIEKAALKKKVFNVFGLKPKGEDVKTNCVNN